MYTTVARIKDRLKDAETITAFDTMLESFVRSASSLINGYCGRSFEYKRTVTNDGTTTPGWIKVIANASCKEIRLDNTPVLSVDSVKTVDRLNSANDITHSNFYVSKEEFLVLGDAITVIPPNELEIVYTGGYKIDFDNYTDETKHTLPATITDVCETLIAKKFQRRDSDGQIRSEFESSIIEWDLVFGEDEEKALAPYVIFPSPQ